jgi:EpsG family
VLYLVIALYLVFLSFYYDFNRRNAPSFRLVHYWLILLILVLISGFRYRLAPDTVAYMYQFQTDVVPLDKISLDYIINSRYQPFWVLLNSICKTFDSFVMLQFLVAWIFNGCVFYFLRRATTKFFTAVLLFYLIFYFYFSMEIMRESLAVAMFLIAIVRYNNKRMLSFYGWLIAAALFHKFALLAVLIGMLAINRRIPAVLKAMLSMAIVVSLASSDNILDYISSLAPFLADLHLELYDVNNKLSTLGLVYNLLRIIPILLVVLYYQYRPLPDLLFRKEVIFPLCWAYVLIVAIRITAIPFMDRISNYFVFFVLACLVSSLADMTAKSSLRAFQLPLVGSAIVLSFVFYVLPLLPPDPLLGDIPTYRRYYPYSSVFSMETDPDRELITSLEAKE